MLYRFFCASLQILTCVCVCLNSDWSIHVAVFTFVVSDNGHYFGFRMASDYYGSERLSSSFLFPRRKRKKKEKSAWRLRNPKENQWWTSMRVCIVFIFGKFIFLSSLKLPFLTIWCQTTHQIFDQRLHIALGTGCMFSRAWHRLRLLPRLVLVHDLSYLVQVTFYPLRLELVSIMCSRAWCRLDAFPRLINITCFFHAWHMLHVFPRLELVTCFPALGSSYVFSRAWHRLHVRPRLVLVTCFPPLGTNYFFSRAQNWLHVSHAWHRLHFLPRLVLV